MWYQITKEKQFYLICKKKIVKNYCYLINVLVSMICQVSKGVLEFLIKEKEFIYYRILFVKES